MYPIQIVYFSNVQVVVPVVGDPENNALNVYMDGQLNFI